MSERREMTAAELMAELGNDLELVVQRDQRDLDRRRSVERNRRDEAPVLAALAEAGLAVGSLSELFHRGINDRAIPVLLVWLPRTHNRDIKESIVRALTDRAARPEAAPAMVREFDRAEDDTGTGLRWAIGNALAEVADDSVFDDVARLAREPRYGRAREMVAVSLGNMRARRADAIVILRELLADDEVAGHAIIALGKLGATEARQEIAPFADDARTWVRNEADKALKRMETPAA